MALQHLPSHPLAADELAILDFERTWWLDGRPKDELIAQILDMDATEYYFTLSVLIHRDDVYAHDPLLVRRLRRASTGSTRRPHTMHGPVLRGLTHHVDPA